MGASSYRDDHSGYDESRSRRMKTGRTQMELIIDKMKSTEERRKALMQAREGLEDAEHQFYEAEEELKRSEAAVMQQIENLDPETKRMLKSMLSKLNKGSRNDIDRDR